MLQSIAESVYRRIFSPYYLRLSVSNSPFEDSQQEIFITFPSSFVSRHSSFLPFSIILPPIAYGLRPSAYSLFFRLETLFLPFFASLYYIMSQILIYPFYTNRPRFV